MQLFCFTFAGGTAAFFNQLECACESKIEFVKMDYPGHGERHKEPFGESFQDLGAEYVELIKKQYKGEGYALMGYSMGSITVTEIIRRIIEDGTLDMPLHIFLAAHDPHVEIDFSYEDMDIDEYVKKRTIKFGGVPEKLLYNQSFWRMYLPLYKADYLMISRYDFNKLTLKTTIPTTIFFSEEDTPKTKMENWKKFFVGECELVEYNGSHFFINDHYEEMAEIIMERLCV